MAGLGTIYGSVCLAGFRCRKSGTAFESSPLGYQRPRITSQTPSHGMTIPRIASCSRTIVPVWADPQLNAMCVLNISTLSYNLVFFLAPPHLQDLHRQMKFIMAHAKAPSTNKTQQSQIKAWFRYCQLAQIPRMGVGPWHLSMYATSLIASGRVKSADSLANYISAVRGYHRKNGFDCPTPSQFGPLQLVISGTRRLALRPIKRSLPITPRMLYNFLTTRLPPPFCPVRSNILTTYKILCLFYYLTMLRCSSLIPRSYGEVDTERLVCWGNIDNLHYNGATGIVVCLHKTKTIQFRERVQEIPLARNDDCPLLCPLRAIAILRGIIGEDSIHADAPLFQVRDYSGTLRPILRHNFDAWFNARLKEMGADPSLYTLHGWRHGGIQQVLMSEQNLALAKITSDHTSDVIMEYAHVPANRRVIISQKVNRNLNRAITGHADALPPLPAGVLTTA